MKKLLFLLLIPFVFACSKDDESDPITTFQVSTYQKSGNDTIPKITNIYIFKGDVKFTGGIDLLEKALFTVYSKSETTILKTNIEPGIYTVAIQLPLTDSYGKGAYSFKSFEIKEGESIRIKKVFEQYLGSYTHDEWIKD